MIAYFNLIFNLIILIACFLTVLCIFARKINIRNVGNIVLYEWLLTFLGHVCIWNLQKNKIFYGIDLHMYNFYFYLAYFSSSSSLQFFSVKETYPSEGFLIYYHSPYLDTFDNQSLYHRLCGIKIKVCVSDFVL